MEVGDLARKTKILTLSVPPEMLEELERVAKAESRTKSELFREALREYVSRRRWRELQAYGRERAQRMGITEADVERLIEEFRREAS